MSASERLRELEASGDPWLAHNALPEIIAVVEAAEAVVRTTKPFYVEDVIAALSALDATLNGDVDPNFPDEIGHPTC